MPRVETLVNFHMGAVKGVDQEQDGSFTDTWTLIFTDRATGDQIHIAFRREARDELVRQLTGGVVLAGGDLPSVP